MSKSRSGTRSAPTTLIRHARLVPVRTLPTSDRPVDIRIAAGLVQQVAFGLRPLPQELVVDAAGRWAIPGLWDQHVHFGQWAQGRTRLDVSGTSHPEEVARIVREHVAALVPGGADSVVIGGGYRSATWSVQPTVELLDAASGGHPVILISGDVHNGWLNSRGLQLLGVPPRTGPLDENDWFLVLAQISELPGVMLGVEDAYRSVAGDAAARGVVGIVDMEFAPGYRDWPARVASGVDQLRVRPATYPDRLDEVIAAGVRSGQELPGGAGLVTMGPLKIISDGSLNTRTASCREPYAGSTSLRFPRGKQNVSLDEIIALLKRARQHGLEIALHAIGDAAVATALDGFEATGATGSIEHAQLLGPDEIRRMSRLGVRASVQPAHLLDDRDVAAQCWPDRIDSCFPLQSLCRAGITLAMGSDAPVAPLDPWLAMAAAVHRSADDREPWNPAEALTPAQALAASTDGQPTVDVGLCGDVVLLDDDPLPRSGDSALAGRQLRQMRVAATLVGGRPTYLAI